MNNVTWVEIDLDAVAHNIRIMRKKVGKDRKILALVKADAYGHGAIEVSRTLVKNDVNMLGVAIPEEGIELRENNVNIPIMLLNPVLPEQVYEALKHSLELTICTLHSATEISRIAKRNFLNAKIHIEVDTGMGGTGVHPGIVLSLIRSLMSLENLTIEGIFTHFHSSEETDKSATIKQNTIFQKILQEIRENNIQIPLVHAANSAATLNMPESYFNMVRLGLVLYGIHPSNSASEDINLKPVMSFKTKIINIKHLDPGSTVGYGGTCKLSRPTKVATIPVGYKDGFCRSFSNLGRVLVNGIAASILGRICMDRCFIDISDIPDAHIGSEVMLYGIQKNERISIESSAKLIGTIPYEIVCNTGRKSQRKYVRNGSTINQIDRKRVPVY